MNSSTLLEVSGISVSFDGFKAIDGVDVLFLGPGDLSLRLGCSPAPGDPAMLEAQKRVAAAAARHGKAWGRPIGSKEDMAIIVELGARFVIMGGDFTWVMNGLKSVESVFNEVLGKK